MLDPLQVPPAQLAQGAKLPVNVLADSNALIRHFADALWQEYLDAKAAGRDKVVFIVPVGPVGQFELLAERCQRAEQSLTDLVLINMDEYLSAASAGTAFISRDDPLSFRRHMDAHFYRLLPPRLAPPPAQRVWPDPQRPDNVSRAIADWGGVDVCFGGVGVTGHLAFNDPPEPDQDVSVEAFAALPTRVVTLSRETRLVNAINAARGNIDRIPARAVTVGMREILASRKIRLYLNRPWQCAIVRKILHGPVSVAVPASLLQNHADCQLTVTRAVTALPEPELQ